MRLRQSLLLAALACVVSGCAHVSVVYPICVYSNATQQDWQTFVTGANAAVKSFFGDEANFNVSSTRRTLTVSGVVGDHERFIPWIAIEGCVPNYQDSTDRGAFVVCTSFLERSAIAALRYSIETQRVQADTPPTRQYAEIIRDMDAQHLMCQQKWK